MDNTQGLHTHTPVSLTLTLTLTPSFSLPLSHARFADTVHALRPGSSQASGLQLWQRRLWNSDHDGRWRTRLQFSECTEHYSECVYLWTTGSIPWRRRWVIAEQRQLRVQFRIRLWIRFWFRFRFGFWPQHLHPGQRH